MFNLLAREELREEKFELQIETLFCFLTLKFKDDKLFACSHKEAERRAAILINEWVKNGKIEKKIKKMWKERF